MKRFHVSILLALLVTMLAVTPALATGGTGHIYAVVFMDNDGNGKWGNEPGISDVTVKFETEDTCIKLGTAWTDNLKSDLSGTSSDFAPDQYCSHLSEDDIEVPRGCNGTVGLIPISGWWDVSVVVPTGCTLTTPGHYKVPTLGIGEAWDDGMEYLQFGLMCSGDDGAAVPQETGIKVFKTTGAALGVKGPETATPMDSPYSWK